MSLTYTTQQCLDAVISVSFPLNLLLLQLSPEAHDYEIKTAMRKISSSLSDQQCNTVYKEYLKASQATNPFTPLLPPLETHTLWLSNDTN